MKKFTTFFMLLWLLIPATSIYAADQTTSGIDTNSTDSNYIEVSSPEEITDILSDGNGDNGMITESEAESDSRYATKRIILFGDLLESYDSAETIITYPEYNETILEFGTEADTKTAYEKLLTIYGKENCILDEVIDQEDLVLEGESSEEDTLIAENESLDENTLNLEGTSTDSSYSAYSWGATNMGMAQLKSTCQSYFSKTEDYDQNVNVTVIDTGINSSNFLFSGRSISGYNTMTSSTDISDKFGHGTHVCGIIADSTPDFARFTVIGVFNQDGESTYTALLTAFQYAIAHDADVINISLGYESRSASTMDFLDNIIDTAYQAGIPIVAAAGNGATNVSHVYPASNSETLAISAAKKVTDTDSASASVTFDSSYSNYGTLIDFCGPGTDIYSANYKSSTSTVCESGTSMAAPHITAAFAWLKILYPNESVSKLYQRLAAYCLDLGTTGKDNYYGNGYPKIGTLLVDRYGTDFLTDNNSGNNGSDTNNSGSNNNGSDTNNSGSNNNSSDTNNSGSNNNDSNTNNSGSNNNGSDTNNSGSNNNSSDTNTNDSESNTNNGSESDTNDSDTNTNDSDSDTNDSKSNDSSNSSDSSSSKSSDTSNSSSSTSSSKSSTVTKPTKTRVTYAKRKGTRTIRLKWKKISNITGYQICYSTTKTFKKGNHYVAIKGKTHTSYTLKQLKRRSSIYVRIRTYKTVGKKKYYSKWSNVKMVKTK